MGKLLGLDHIPEVITLRTKVAILRDATERTARWSGQLAREWMAHDVLKPAWRLSKPTLVRPDGAHSLVRGLLKTTINLRPDPAKVELRVEAHGHANPIHDAMVVTLCHELNLTEAHYPGTKIRLNFVTLRSAPFPPAEDVWASPIPFQSNLHSNLPLIISLFS